MKDDRKKPSNINPQFIEGDSVRIKGDFGTIVDYLGLTTPINNGRREERLEHTYLVRINGKEFQRYENEIKEI